MDTRVMFLDCPAYMDEQGTARCGLPAAVQYRYMVTSTDGPLESAKIRCPRGHWLNGPVEALTWENTRARPPAPQLAPAISTSFDGWQEIAHQPALRPIADRVAEATSRRIASAGRQAVEPAQSGNRPLSIAVKPIRTGRRAAVSLSSVMGPGCCHEEGFWREFRDQVTVGDRWRGGSANRAAVVPLAGASGF